ncbi:MAG TPA: hypothetical protein IAA51_12490 [Candidatus Cottocaccamicrobium excrementipullorum]|nr:hypothetical protein [Candidatus Cottocaccamicrobium excrementipullorum]
MKIVSLLDTMSIHMGCTYLSDLRFLSIDQHKKLAEILRHLPAEAFDLREWNDALYYLTREMGPGTNAEETRNALIEWLLKH